ncbi:hypothetical protein PHISCL_10837 [Aspergillus sclerotialis]|uniref:Uncharacterized protein n=1 Tax=Aspergillus sclerotialis TaxID=2070753 RepID=A0A3A2Z1R2_9EURO|nr:hypothetical protein PHISCL_10837 [Aspergillus sclerotialis]
MLQSSSPTSSNTIKGRSPSHTILVSSDEQSPRMPLMIPGDVLRMVLGNTRWTLDFLHYILNELFELADDLESVFTDQEAFTQNGQ